MSQTAEDVLNELGVSAEEVLEEETVNVASNNVMPEPTVVPAKEVSVEKQAVKVATKEAESVVASKGNLDYSATVTLPSKGMLYGGSIPSDITLRGMTTRDEKILYASQSNDVFKRILSACIVDPANIDVNKLVASDELFLVLQLRMITYGPEYKVEVECPECGNTSEYVVMLNELDVNYLQDDFTEPITVTLPRCGDKLELRLLRNEDTEFIDKYSRKFAKRFNLSPSEVEFTARLAKYIVSINGNRPSFEDAVDYVENLMSRDSAEIRSAMSKILFGVETNVTVECKDCGSEFTFAMPLTSEFFRPTFE